MPTWRDYVSLLKLRIAALLLLVAAAGYVVAGAPRIDLAAFGLLMASGLLASGGASAANHYVDRDLDGMMARTRGRPIPAGRVPAGHSLALAATLLLASLTLALSVNAATAAFVLLGFAFYVVVYTIALKRRTVWNIVIGGFAGSCSALAGGAAAVGGVALGPALLALLVFLWTPGHFWALAYLMREDYVRARLPMLPAVVAERSAVRLIVLSTAFVPPFAISFWLLGVSGFAYLGVAVAAGAGLLWLAYRFLREASRRNGWAAYRASGVYLAAVVLALVADRVL